ncbi:MAG: pseudouridylate synthase [Bacteroidales bacterium]|nr:pseudouridylate synthase [Bacteroidales bacterium]
MMTDFESLDICGILPQRPPFVFVSKIKWFEGTDITTEYTVKEDCPLLEDGILCPEALMEVMAQSNAARIGYIAKYILHKPVDIGYIGDVRGYRVVRCPKVGEILTTDVKLLGEIGGLAKIYAEIKDAEGEKIACATMKTALKQEKDDESI